MGVHSGLTSDAWRGYGPDRGDDPAKTGGQCAARGLGDCCRHLIRCLTLAALLICLGTLAAQADGGLKLAVWNSDLERKGPGLLLRDIASGKNEQVEAALQMVASLDADAILLTGFDYDHGLLAARHFTERVAALGPAYPHIASLRPNRGMATGLDLDGDGRKGGPGDAQGWGWFSGQSGMVILSKYPIDTAGIRDFSSFLWSDLPGALWPDQLPDKARQVLRLSTTGHWEVPLILPDGSRLRLLAWHGSAPVFGNGDMNERRNHDESAFWNALLEGRLPYPPPEGPFVILGISNLDALDGDGRHDAIRRLIAHPQLQDPRPRADWQPREAGHKGDPGLDTTVLPQTGGLRLALILPDAGQRVAEAGILRPPPGDPLAGIAAKASRSFPVWVRLLAPSPSPSDASPEHKARAP